MSLVSDLGVLSDRFTIHALSTNETFPSVTLPYFEVAAGRDVRQVTGIIGSVAFAPLVTLDQKAEWEAYSLQHQNWLEESERALSLPSSYQGLNISSYIYDRDVNGNTYPVQGVGPYFPLWQVSPPPSNLSQFINFNLASSGLFNAMLENATHLNGKWSLHLMRFR